MTMAYVSDAERASRIRDAVLSLAESNPDGVCEPRALVSAAKRKSHPCHAMFEWDDTAAAAAYRVDQARRIIRSVQVTFDGGDTKAPAFVHVTIDKGSERVNGYMPTDKAMKAPDIKEQVLADALGQLRGLQNRYAGLRELAPVWSALDAVDGAA